MGFEVQDTDIILTNSKYSGAPSSCQRVFFDIEGGLSYNSDVLQLACIITDWDFNIKKIQNEYFRNSHPISQEEFKVHHLSEEFLWKHAEHMFITEIGKFPFYETTPTMYITYSSFDIRKIQETVFKASLPEVDFGEPVSSLTVVPKTANHFDAFILGGTKLTKTITSGMRTRIENTIKDISKNSDVSRLMAHDALYDTIVLLELCKEMMH